MHRGAQIVEHGSLSTELKELLAGIQSVGSRSADLFQADQIAELTGSYESIAHMGGVLLQDHEFAALSGSGRVLHQLMQLTRREPAQEALNH